MVDLTPEEKQRIYLEEKARLEAQERLKAERAELEAQQSQQAQPQKPKHRMGCGTGLLILVGLIGLAIIYSTIQGRKYSLPPGYDGTPVAQPEQHFIDSTVLRSWTPGRRGTGLDLLVAPTATRTEVMQLAYHLLETNRSTGNVVIFIFDDRTAWANRENDSFPQATYMRHFLVSVMSPHPGGQSEVTWMAEGRAEPPSKK